MKKIFALIMTAVFMLAIATPAFAAGGFNEYGYNYGARIFVGPADGVDKVLDGAVWGDPTYANDHLVMKWNAQWDNCNDVGNNSVDACLGAWTTNEWNGMNPDGSQSVWHYKMIWVGSGSTASAYWQEGGYPIWGNYEVIQDFGFDPTGHYKYAFTRPGLGLNK
jgi:hypothetical protein